MEPVVVTCHNDLKNVKSNLLKCLHDVSQIKAKSVKLYCLNFRQPEVPAWHAILLAAPMDLSLPELEKLILATKVILVNKHIKN